MHETHLLEWFSPSNSQLLAEMTVVASKVKRLLWKSLEELNPAYEYEEKEEKLKRVNRGRGRPPKAPEFLGSLLWLVNPFEAVGSNSLST